jgi:hypothetical protein
MQSEAALLDAALQPHAAIQNAHRRAVKFLVSDAGALANGQLHAGASIYQRDGAGRAPLDIARTSGRTDVVRVLEAAFNRAAKAAAEEADQAFGATASPAKPTGKGSKAAKRKKSGPRNGSTGTSTGPGLPVRAQVIDAGTARVASSNRDDAGDGADGAADADRVEDADSDGAAVQQRLTSPLHRRTVEAADFVHSDSSHSDADSAKGWHIAGKRGRRSRQPQRKHREPDSDIGLNEIQFTDTRELRLDHLAESHASLAEPGCNEQGPLPKGAASASAPSSAAHSGADQAETLHAPDAVRSSGRSTASDPVRTFCEVAGSSAAHLDASAPAAQLSAPAVEQLQPIGKPLQALAALPVEAEDAAALDIHAEHLLGLGMEALSMAQLECLEEWHYGQLERINACKLQIHRRLQQEALDEALQLDADIREALNRDTQ